MSHVAPLLLVVPCYNEASRFDATAFLDAVQALPALRLCFVDDGSTDTTGHVLRTLQQRAPDRIEILTLAQNSGKAEAVRLRWPIAWPGDASAVTRLS